VDAGQGIATAQVARPAALRQNPAAAKATALAKDAVAARAGAAAKAGAPAKSAAPAKAAASAHSPSSPRMITLTVADNGRHIRVPRGEHVMVQLRVNPRRDVDRTTWWRPISEDGRALQTRVVGTMIPRGVTAGHYYAIRRGQATLSSARSACPVVKNGPTCHAMQGWSVTVDVR
jgi:hypothetical protein